jgi:uncharacterized protein YggE
MTLTITPRRASLVLLAAIGLTVVYVVGATRSGGAPATSTQTRTVGTASALPSTVPAIGGSGITVGGRANVSGTPDTLRLDLSVVATASSVSEALAKANGSADAVQKSLLGSGVATKDLQTSGLNISPDYDYSTSGTPRLRGYQVSVSVSAKLRDLGRAGDTIGKAVGAGGNTIRVNGISLDLEETSVLVSKARDKAFADARTKAEQYAKASGRALGDVLTIAENVATPSPMPYAASAGAPLDKASVPIQSGSQDVSVSVTVVFAMR